MNVLRSNNRFSHASADECEVFCHRNENRDERILWRVMPLSIQSGADMDDITICGGIHRGLNCRIVSTTIPFYNPGPRVAPGRCEQDQESSSQKNSQPRSHSLPLYGTPGEGANVL